jgi:ATP:ADP antiporter, AAA family
MQRPSSASSIVAIGIRGMILRLLQRFSRKEKNFLLLATLCGFFISADYAIIRPASHSIFIHSFGASAFPIAWLFSIPFNLGLVSLYNHLLPKVGSLRLFWITSAAIIVMNAITGAFIGKMPLLSFPFYIWKEVYVLLMLQQVWSVIHATISLKKAKYLYGVLFGFGALGGCLGSLVPGFFAVKLGSESLFYCSIPLYLFLSYIYYYFFMHSSLCEGGAFQENKRSFSLFEGVKLIYSSHLLRSIAILTLCMQITASLTDFQFQSFLERMYPEKDIRTEVFGKVVSLGNICTMTLQFFGTFVCVHYLGLQRAHLLVPSLLTVGMSLVLAFPLFSVFASFFISIKSLEFSVFTVVKEMLYVPMRLEEKFQAKAIIDVFIYRASKIIASLSILILQYFFSAFCFPLLCMVSLTIFLCWIKVVFSLKTSYQESELLSQKQGSL